MSRCGHENRNPFAGAMITLCVAVLGLTVLWQLGHAFVPDASSDTASGNATVAEYFATTDVNLRRGPGVEHDILRVLPVKSGVSVVGDEQDGFAPVEVDGRQAWVSVDYIAPEDSVLAATEQVAVEGQPDEEQAVAANAEPTAMTSVASIEDEPESDAPDGSMDTVASEMPAVSTEFVGKESVVPSGERWIEVDRTLRTVTLHHGDAVVAIYDGLMGKDSSQDGYYATAIGTFHVFSMNRALTETPFAPGVYLTDWVGFDPDRSNGFHSPVRNAAGDVVVTGGTTTLGCIRLSEDNARTLFDFAEIGMRVEVHD